MSALTSSRVPALDGIRGLAIALVVAGHAIGGSYGPAAKVGVAVFFTLSGYLITRLLLDEHARHGRIDLPAFYRRRARRLLPALVVMLAVLLALRAVLGTPFPSVRDGIPALFYVANFDRILNPSEGQPLGHIWSLSIEEQFYLALPVVVVLLLPRRRLLGVVLASAAAASVALRVLLEVGGASVERILYGTDTTACLLLAGALLAVATRRRGELAPALAWLATALLVVLGAFPTILPPIRVTAGLFAACLTLVLIAAQPPHWLTSRPLIVLGQRSYGLYLWHWPVLVILAPRLGGGPVAVVACLVCAWVLTLLSWRYVEQPFLNRGRERRRLAILAATVTL